MSASQPGPLRESPSIVVGRALLAAIDSLPPEAPTACVLRSPDEPDVVLAASENGGRLDLADHPIDGDAIRWPAR